MTSRGRKIWIIKGETEFNPRWDEPKEAQDS